MAALEAAARDEMLLSTIDLSGYAAGPIEVEIASGGLAVVALGPGFFQDLATSLFGVEIPSGGRVLVVDLDAEEVVADLETAHSPMGIAVSPDGTTAYTANFGDNDAQGTTVSIIDLETLAIADEIEVGARPEQIVLDPAGEWALVNVTGAGIRLFQTADPAGTLTEPLLTSADPSDVVFVPGTNVGVVANSASEQNYTVLDLSDPAAPAIAYQSEPRTAILYGATWVPGTQSVVVTGTTLREIEFLRMDVGQDPPVEEWQFMHPTESATLPLGIAITDDGKRGLCASPGDGSLVVVDVDAGTARSVPWLSELGPSYVALE